MHLARKQASRQAGAHESSRPASRSVQSGNCWQNPLWVAWLPPQSSRPPAVSPSAAVA